MWVKPSPALKTLVRLTSKNDTFLLLLIVPSFSMEGQSFSGGLSENVFHVLLILCRTLEVELCIHLLPGLLTLHPQQTQLQELDCNGYDICMVSKDNCTFGKDLLLYWNRDTVTYGCRFWLACVLIVFVQFAIPVCKWWEPDSGPWASLNTLYPSWGQSCSQSEWPECPDRSVSPLETTG